MKVPHSVDYNGTKVHLCKGMLLFIDLVECNRSSDHFPNPNEFDIDNINSDLLNGKGLMGFLNDLNSIRSFGGGHYPKASSRCPGRFFMVSIGVLAIANLYAMDKVVSENISVKFENESTLQLHSHNEDTGRIMTKG